MSAPEPGLPDFEALYQEAACGLLLTDKAGTILLANRTIGRWLGMEPEQLVGKRRFQELLSMGARIFHQTHWAPLLQMQGSVAEVKLDLVRSDGRSLPTVMNAVSREHQGRTCHELALFLAEDRHAYERELMRARRQAEQLLAEQQDRSIFAEQMVGIVSHDLRSPLSALTLGVELLSRAGPTPGQELVLANLGRSVKRARRLIDDLLDFTVARLGQGLTMQVKEFDLHAAVANQVAELGLANAGRIIVHQQFGEGLCRADGDRLFQVLSNLVANAFAYGALDRPVTVTSRIAEGSFAIVVHNYGPHIPEHLQPNLFQPMVRGTEAGSAMRSVGLGLYIVSEIARAHGGQVRVTSTPEDGTEFIATFPLAECSAASTE